MKMKVVNKGGGNSFEIESPTFPIMGDTIFHYNEENPDHPDEYIVRYRIHVKNECWIVVDFRSKQSLLDIVNSEENS